MTIPVHSVDLGPADVRGWFTGRPAHDASSVGQAGNLSHRRPHAPTRLAADRRAVAAEIGFPVASWQWMGQVHGASVAVVGEDTPDGAEHRAVDGMVTTRHDVPLVVQVADCVPVLFASDVAVGVAHAGRRGIELGVVEAVVARLRGVGTKAIDAVVGPSIGGCCYEVPREMHDSFVANDPSAAAITTWGTPSLDLSAAVMHRLSVLDVEVTSFEACTRCDPDRQWFSHRADPTAGRLVGIVVRQGR
ncbi:MAG: polyphenol oxidase family protein [Nitriliruptoraceae bacterium]